MADNQVIAKKSDWETEEMPAKKKKFRLRRHFSAEEIENLRYGSIPQEMEDKWFWYMENDTLYAHRSWTGYCIFIVSFRFDKDIHDVTVNRDAEQYRSSSLKEDEEMLNSLLNWWVLPRNQPSRF